ncbi:MAG TPA: FAD-dependent oxidoreductase, partial [Candidatus Limnocylindrales bacterium]|nr:FAD-dependent oxidoreductase [Candidatus Limnocylindrales bacterium]
MGRGQRTPLRIVVLGAGVGGLASALALGRAGHRVTLLERDAVEAGDPQASVEWQRRGIPHFLQAHSLTARGSLELLREFPDVHQALIEAGANDIDLASKVPGGERRPGDEELRILGVRRPLIEWAFRAAVLAEATIDVRSGVTATGLDGIGNTMPRVTGVRTPDGSIEADLVIDAMGRRSPAAGWIVALGGTPMAEETSDCGVIYYTRYYR